MARALEVMGKKNLHQKYYCRLYSRENENEIRNPVKLYFTFHTIIRLNFKYIFTFKLLSITV